jgi:hypothetical protein
VVVSEDPPLASRVRDRPGVDGTVIGMLEPGQRAVIVDGPICGDRYVWWHLQPDGSAVEGWVAQGNPYASWLQPVD